MSIPVIRETGNQLVGVYEPGNGTRYVAAAMPWIAPPVYMEGLGEVADGWLVVAGNGRAYCFQRAGFLTDDYVEEKLGGGHYRPEDTEHLAQLIRTLLARPGLPTLPVSEEPWR